MVPIVLMVPIAYSDGSDGKMLLMVPMVLMPDVSDGSNGSEGNCELIDATTRFVLQYFPII